MSSSPDILSGPRVWIGGHNRHARAAVEPHVARSPRVRDGALDRLVVTPLVFDEFCYFAAKHLPRLGPAGEFWLVTSTESGVSLRESVKAWCADQALSGPVTRELGDSATLDVWRRPTPPPQPPAIR